MRRFLRTAAPATRAAHPWWTMLLRALLALGLAAVMLVGPKSELADFVWALGMYWLADGVLLMVLWTTGPLRGTPGPVLRGMLEAMAGFAVVTNPALGLLFYFASYMAAGLLIAMAGLAEAVNGLRGRLGRHGRGAHGVAGIMLAATAGGFMAAPYISGMDFSVYIGGVAVAGGIAMVLHATRLGFAGDD